MVCINSKTLFSIFVSIIYALYCRYYRYHKPYQQNSWLSYRHPAMMAEQLLFHWPIHIRTWLCVSPTCQEKIYNIWVISRVLIGWELWSIRAQTMEITWWWCNLFFTSLRTQLSKNLEPEMDIKNHQKKDSIEMMPMFKTLFHFSFEHFDLIFMVGKSTDHGKL